MKLYEQIRRAHALGQVSFRELFCRFGVHRRDVGAALVSLVPPVRKAGPLVRAPKLDPWRLVIDGWLEADLEAPRK